VTSGGGGRRSFFTLLRGGMREESVREERRESGENEDHRCVGGDARNPMIRSSMSSDMFYGVYGTNVMMTSHHHHSTSVDYSKLR
jgi:hypothetical protein